MKAKRSLSNKKAEPAKIKAKDYDAVLINLIAVLHEKDQEIASLKKEIETLKIDRNEK